MPRQRCYITYLLKHSSQELFDMAISHYFFSLRKYITLHSKPEKKELFLQLLKWMPGQGNAIDSSTRNLILKNSHLFGHQLTAVSLSKQLVMSKKGETTQGKCKIMEAGWLSWTSICCIENFDTLQVFS